MPGVLLTVSGPGAVHGIAGLSHAQVNTWPMLMISGSAEQVRALPARPSMPPRMLGQRLTHHPAVAP